MLLEPFGSDLVYTIWEVINEYIAKKKPIAPESYQLLADILSHARNYGEEDFTLNDD